MILDEPSNHLDIEATEWLEEFLLESSAAMIVVSHDRYFLDKVTNRTLELFHGTVDATPAISRPTGSRRPSGCWSQRRTYEKQQIEIEKTKDFIRRNAYGQKHAQAEDRRKKLERIEPVAAAARDRRAADGLSRRPRAAATSCVRAEGLAKALRPAAVRRRLASTSSAASAGRMLGPNGCGKTTLLRCLLGQIEPDAGQVSLGQGVDGRLLRPATGRAWTTTRRWSMPIRPTHKQLERAAAARSAGPLRPDRRHGLAEGRQPQRRRAVPRGPGPAGRRGRQFPGARRADEPPRPLGPRRAGKGRCASFDGTVLFVSHDRYFVNRVADHLLVVEPGRFRVDRRQLRHVSRSGRARAGPTGRRGGQRTDSRRIRAEGSAVAGKTIARTRKPSRRSGGFRTARCRTWKRRSSERETAVGRSPRRPGPARNPPRRQARPPESSARSTNYQAALEDALRPLGRGDGDELVGASGQWAVGSGQWAVAWAVGSGQWGCQ